MMKRKSFWVSLCIINLSIVALLGFGLRSKMLFSLPGIDFQQLESAHSHFAFAGWASLSLITLLIYNILPEVLSAKKIYQWVLAGIEVSALGMLIVFPFYGYNAVSIFFSTLYIFVSLIFVPVFIKDVIKAGNHKIVTWLSVSALCFLILSFLGTAGLVYILASKTGNSILYRDSIYTFLHFQYNGFFTLSIFALFLHDMIKRNIIPGSVVRTFVISLCISVIPALFLSLLWHNNTFFYVLALIGCVFILISLFSFFGIMRASGRLSYSSALAKYFLLFAGLSFALKMLLNVGTIIPQLGDAIYGNRPVIIGFLHLVFLGFLSFYLFHAFIESGYFTKAGKVIRLPFYVFATGIFMNELLLMIQGLGILFQTNNEIYRWLLWIAAIVLSAGGIMLVLARMAVVTQNKKDTA